MRRRLAFGVLLVAALGLAVTTSAGKPPAIKAVPVTVTIEKGYAIESDGDGAYINGTGGVTAVIVPLGNLQLQTGTQRAFWLDLGDCVSQGSCSPPSLGAGYTQGYMTTSCPESLLVMDPLESQYCNLNVHFTADGLGWFIRFGQGQGYDTTPATVTRNTTSNWTIAVPEGGIALLQSYPLKGRVTWADHGYFYMPVHLTVTQP